MFGLHYKLERNAIGFVIAVIIVASIGGFVGFHPMIELPLTFFTRITGEMGIHQFLFLERAEGYGREIMKQPRRTAIQIFDQQTADMLRDTVRSFAADRIAPDAHEALVSA